MLEFDRLQEDILSLPEDAQQMVIDFVRLLRQRYQTSKTASPQPLSFDDQPFVGMWSDRTDMQDSTAWVRKMRQQQW
ncbi:MAG: DUF2281 domain-containing protein [Symploca sp. SIO3E6]|nr:DUF2281 domain-containing protein [Caldora sp. SIO3E6]